MSNLSLKLDEARHTLKLVQRQADAKRRDSNLLRQKLASTRLKLSDVHAMLDGRISGYLTFQRLMTDEKLRKGCNTLTGWKTSELFKSFWEWVDGGKNVGVIVASCSTSRKAHLRRGQRAATFESLAWTMPSSCSGSSRNKTSAAALFAGIRRDSEKSMSGSTFDASTCSSCGCARTRVKSMRATRCTRSDWARHPRIAVRRVLCIIYHVCIAKSLLVRCGVDAPRPTHSFSSPG